MEKPLEDTDVICQKQNETKYLKASKQNFSKAQGYRTCMFPPNSNIVWKEKQTQNRVNEL